MTFPILLLAVVLLGLASRRQADRYRLALRVRRRARVAGALLLALSFALAMSAGGGLLDLIEWALAFGLIVPVVALGFTIHATQR